MLGRKKSKIPKDVADLPMLPLRITKPNADIIKIVDEFVDRFYKHEYVLNFDARQIPIAFPEEWGFQSSNLAVYLLNNMENYLITKDKPNEHDEWTCKLFSLITHAYGANVIETGDAEKFKKCDEENQRLRDIRVKLEAEILQLRKDNEDLHKALNLFAGRSDATPTSP